MERCQAHKTVPLVVPNLEEEAAQLDTTLLKMYVKPLQYLKMLLHLSWIPLLSQMQ